jgi:hypothetical protein
MNKVDYYREVLLALDDWTDYLLAESGLPGPRGNIELARAVALEADVDRLTYYLSFDAESAPTNSPYEFLAFCGTLGQGRLVSEGNLEALKILRQAASDNRWRIREAVAMALQDYGSHDMAGLLKEMEVWREGNHLEQRAAAAALCEPALLKDLIITQEVLRILDAITANLHESEDRREAPFKVLRKGLGYCWSVAVVANPPTGKGFMEKWLIVEDPDVRWIMRENLKKKRMMRMDPEWVSKWMAKLSPAS